MSAPCLGITMFGRWHPLDSDLQRYRFGAFLFIKAMQIRVAQIGRFKSPARETMKVARSIYQDFGAKFGDPAYAWTVGAAINLADEFMEDR